MAGHAELPDHEHVKGAARAPTLPIRDGYAAAGNVPQHQRVGPAGISGEPGREARAPRFTPTANIRLI